MMPRLICALLCLSMLVNASDVVIRVACSKNLFFDHTGDVVYGNTKKGSKAGNLLYLTTHNFESGHTSPIDFVLWKDKLEIRVSSVALVATYNKATVVIYEGSEPTNDEINFIKDNKLNIIVIVLTQPLSKLIETTCNNPKSRVFNAMIVFQSDHKEDYVRRKSSPSNSSSHDSSSNSHPSPNPPPKPPMPAPVPPAHPCPTPKPDHLHYEVWYTPGDPEMLELFSYLSDAHKSLGSNLTFTPHLKVCQAQSHDAYDKKDCLTVKNNCYCVLPMRGMGSLTGADILKLGITELCLYDQASQSRDFAMWHEYQAKLRGCTPNTLTIGCARNALPAAKLNLTTLELCESNIDDRLKNEAHSSACAGFCKSPHKAPPAFFVINDKQFTGYLNSTVFLSTLCTQDWIKSEYCNEVLQGNISNFSCRVSWVLEYILLSVLIIITCILLYLHYQKQHKKQAEPVADPGSVPLQDAT